MEEQLNELEKQIEDKKLIRNWIIVIIFTAGIIFDIVFASKSFWDNYRYIGELILMGLISLVVYGYYYLRIYLLELKKLKKDISNSSMQTEQPSLKE